MESGTTRTAWMCSGVDAPTQAASNQWVLGSSRIVRLYLVRPPVPHSTGKPSASNLSKRALRVALTAEASASGALAWAKIFLRRSGFLERKSLMSLVPFAWLHFSQAKQRLLTLSVPPLA